MNREPCGIPMVEAVAILPRILGSIARVRQPASVPRWRSAPWLRLGHRSRDAHGSGKMLLSQVAIGSENAAVAAEQCVGMDVPSRVHSCRPRRVADRRPMADCRMRWPRSSLALSDRDLDRAPARRCRQRRSWSRPKSRAPGPQQQPGLPRSSSGDRQRPRFAAPGPAPDDTAADDWHRGHQTICSKLHAKPD